MSVSSEIENDTEPSVSRDTSIEENAKERAKVHRQQANKTRTADQEITQASRFIKRQAPQSLDQGLRHYQ